MLHGLRLFTPIFDRRFSALSTSQVLVLGASAKGSRVSLEPSNDPSASIAQDGSFVEARDRATKRLIGFGFFNASVNAVDLVEKISPKTMIVPKIDEQYFRLRFLESVDKKAMPILTTSCRVLSGAADIMSGLYVDRFSSSYARVIATNLGAESLVPLVLESLVELGAEEVVVFSPSIGVARTRLAANGYCRNATFMELGLSYPWPERSEMCDETLVQKYFNFAEREARLALLTLCSGKAVCLVNCPEETSLLCAVNASAATIVNHQHEMLDRTRDFLRLNFGNIDLASSNIILVNSIGDAAASRTITHDVFVVQCDVGDDLLGPASRAMIDQMMDLVHMSLATQSETRIVRLVVLVRKASCGVLEWGPRDHYNDQPGTVPAEMKPKVRRDAANLDTAPSDGGDDVPLPDEAKLLVRGLKERFAQRHLSSSQTSPANWKIESFCVGNVFSSVTFVVAK